MQEGRPDVCGVATGCFDFVPSPPSPATELRSACPRSGEWWQWRCSLGVLVRDEKAPAAPSSLARLYLREIFIHHRSVVRSARPAIQHHPRQKDHCSSGWLTRSEVILSRRREGEGGAARSRRTPRNARQTPGRLRCCHGMLRLHSASAFARGGTPLSMTSILKAKLRTRLCPANRQALG